MTQETTANAKPFVISKWFKATPERLYRAFVTADNLVVWMGPKGATLSVVRLTAYEGGVCHYGMTMRYGMTMYARGSSSTWCRASGWP